MLSSAIESKPKTPFGVEIELNSFDESQHIGLEKVPGMYEVAFLINRACKDKVFVSKWCNNHNNSYWVVKPDSSCGMEICSPVLKGWYGIRKVFKVIDSIRSDSRVKSDSRCSLHVHFDVSAMSERDLLSVISWWIKLESFFLDAMPATRKVNPYCRIISQSDIIRDVSHSYDLQYLVEKLGKSKYYTLNTFHYYNNRRRTIEFRIMDNLCCLSPKSACCWVSLLDHFINRAISSGPPGPFAASDYFSSYCWLDPIDSFDFLGFSKGNDLCRRMNFVRSWLVHRLAVYGKNYLDCGVFSKTLRSGSYKEIRALQESFRNK